MIKLHLVHSLFYNRRLNYYIAFLLIDSIMTQLLATRVANRNRHRLKTSNKIVQFLDVNEHSWRGSIEQLVNQEDFNCSFINNQGNFVNRVKFTARQNPQFKKAVISMLQNGKCTLNLIQNQMVHILKDMLLNAVIKQSKRS